MAPFAVNAQERSSGGVLKGGTLKGVYFNVKVGWQYSLADSEQYGDLTRYGKDGFSLNAAAGVRLDYDLPFWLSSEIELGFHRYRLGVLTPNSIEDRSQVLSFMGNVFIHPLDIHSPHNLFFGAGLGGGFASAKLTQEGQQDDNKPTLSGVNFVAQASLGYSYRVLERSQFSSDYVSVGVMGRYFFADGFRQEHLGQALLVLTYGF